MLPSQIKLAKWPCVCWGVHGGHLLLIPGSEVTVVGERQLPRTRGSGQSNNHSFLSASFEFFVSPGKTIIYSLMKLWFGLLFSSKEFTSEGKMGMSPTHTLFLIFFWNCWYTTNDDGIVPTPSQGFYISICFLVWVAQTSSREPLINT